MNAGHSITWEKLAVVAGKEAGMRRPSAAGVAADDAARERRDLLWGDYERMLRDKKTYTLEALRAWLAERGIRVSLATADRNRQQVLDQDRKWTLVNERMRQFLELSKDSGEGEILGAATKRAGQILCEAFLRMPTEALDAMSPAKILKAFEVAGKLRKAGADVGLIEQRMHEVGQAARKELDAKAAKTKDGRLTREDVYETLDRVMKGEAA